MADSYKEIRYKGKIVFNKLKVNSPSDRELKPFQENEACFMFLNKGEFSIRTPEGMLEFRQGEGVIAKCFNFFIETNEQQRNKYDFTEVLGVFLFPDHIEQLLDLDLDRSEATVNYNLKRLALDQLLTSFQNSINTLLDNPDLANESLVEMKIKEFILLISKSQNMGVLDFMASMFKLNTSNFKSIIRNHLYSNLSIDELSQLCALSTSAFKRKFKELFQESPRKYITRKKVEKAAAVLKSTKEQISSIAYDCGFETISTFNRAFKSMYGISPSIYRKNQNAHYLNDIAKSVSPES